MENTSAWSLQYTGIIRDLTFFGWQRVLFRRLGVLQLRPVERGDFGHVRFVCHDEL